MDAEADEREEEGGWGVEVSIMSREVAEVVPFVWVGGTERSAAEIAAVSPVAVVASMEEGTEAVDGTGAGSRGYVATLTAPLPSVMNRT